MASAFVLPSKSPTSGKAGCASEVHQCCFGWRSSALLVVFQDVCPSLCGGLINWTFKAPLLPDRLYDLEDRQSSRRYEGPANRWRKEDLCHALTTAAFTSSCHAKLGALMVHLGTFALPTACTCMMWKTALQFSFSLLTW